MYFLRMGEKVALVTKPTWVPAAKIGTGSRDARPATSGGSPTEAKRRSMRGQSTSSPAKAHLEGRAASRSSALLPTKSRPGRGSTAHPRPAS